VDPTGEHHEICRLALLALLGFAGPAAAVFTGPTAPANWTVTNTGSLIGGSPTLGSATFTTTQLMMTGSNSTSPGGDAPGCTADSSRRSGRVSCR
jgi:hypothetical protein